MDEDKIEKTGGFDALKRDIDRHAGGGRRLRRSRSRSAPCPKRAKASSQLPRDRLLLAPKAPKISQGLHRVMSGVSAFSVLRNRDFFFYSLATLLAAFAAEILVIAIGWQIYEISGNPADLGLLGLVQFLPNCVLVLVTGTVADRYSAQD